ncbi:uncharacterized protein [Haliotis asinina]|uniref:uncharacterized protein n=1 Tax=Haliotis asinina TaxID=109174 RepID=UPI0035326846
MPWIFLHHLHLEIMYMCCQIVFSVITLTNSCMPDLQYGKRLVGSTFKIIENSVLFSCAAECTSMGMCKSFNFESRLRTCQLNKFNDPQYLRDGGEEEGVIYSPIMNWNKTALGPCQHVTCGYTERCRLERNGIVRCVDFLPNIAKDKPASASSIWRRDVLPSAAVDGDIRAYWKSKSCFATAEGDMSPWWQVDLQNTYVVVEVRVTSRDDCCPERLHVYSVYVYQGDPLVNTTDPPQLCYMYIGKVTVPGQIVAEKCTARVAGRYLRLTGDQTIDSCDILQFCEVQVFGFKML